LVEGIFDTARLHELGIPAVGLLGSSVSDEQIALLKAARVQAIYVLLDSGAIKAARKVVYRVSREIFVRSVELPDGDDPATVSADFLRNRVPVFES